MDLRARLAAEPSRILMGAAALLVLAGVAWSVWLRPADDFADPGSESAKLVAPAELSAYARSAEGPIYWAGRQGSSALEVTTAPDGTIYVRYLDPGVEAGDPRPGFLTVATYPVDDALPSLQAAVERRGAITFESPAGDLVVTNRDAPSSVYTSPAPGVQVEVYDPSPQRAAEVARSGAVQPVR